MIGEYIGEIRLLGGGLRSCNDPIESWLLKSNFLLPQMFCQSTRASTFDRSVIDSGFLSMKALRMRPRCLLPIFGTCQGVLAKKLWSECSGEFRFD